MYGIYLILGIAIIIWLLIMLTKPRPQSSSQKTVSREDEVIKKEKGITILKIFFFDLSFLDQLQRIISFIGLGVILLLMSYFCQKYSKQIRELIKDDFGTVEKPL